MVRYNNWAERLEVYLAECRNRKFESGQWDCSLFVAEAIERMTGVDLAVDLRGKYRTAQESRDLLRGLYGTPLLSRAIAEHIAPAAGWERVRVPFAGRADVVLLTVNHQRALGLVAFDGMNVLAAGQLGLVSVPKDKAVKAWRF